jgi:hypothetical protein
MWADGRTLCVPSRSLPGQRFQKGWRVIIPDITPDWSAVEFQAGFSMHSGSLLNGWKFPIHKDRLFAEFFHVNETDGNMALLPKDMEPATAPKSTEPRISSITARVTLLTRFWK